MTTVSKNTTAAAAGAEIDRRAEQYMAANNCGYTEAWHAALAADRQLAETYGQPATRMTRMATTDPRLKPAVPISVADEREIREWMLRALQDNMAGMLPGALGQLSIEAARLKKTGMPVEEAVSRAMALYPHLVAGAKMLIADLRRNDPKNASFVVHTRAVALTEKHPHMDYRAAMCAVLNEDSDLKARYVRS
jgi:hypothetical protein